MSGGGLILSAGRVYCDLVFAGLDAPMAMGREVFADQLKLCTGGGAFITAAYLAALGDNVGLLGMLPAAPFSALVEEEMRQSGIADFSAKAPGRDVQLTAAVVGEADRAFVTRRVGLAVPQIKIDALPAANHLHVGELTTALEHPDLITNARSLGMSVSLDCGWDETILQRPDLATVIEQVDLFLPNEDEAEALKNAGTSVAPRIATIVKLGEAGAVCRPTHGPVVRRSGQCVDVLDTTGAGDAFNAGFLSAWLAGQSFDEALSLGNACGAVAVSRLGGATDLPKLDELKGQLFARDSVQQAAQ